MQGQELALGAQVEPERGVEDAVGGDVRAGSSEARRVAGERRRIPPGAGRFCFCFFVAAAGGDPGRGGGLVPSTPGTRASSVGAAAGRAGGISKASPPGKRFAPRGFERVRMPEKTHPVTSTGSAPTFMSSASPRGSARGAGVVAVVVVVHDAASEGPGARAAGTSGGSEAARGRGARAGRCT